MNAHDRSMALLQAHLTPRQRKQLALGRHFDVRGSEGTSYRIYDAPFMARNVARLDGKGRPVTLYGAWPALYGEYHMEVLPRGDVMLGQKLILEHDESRLRDIACSLPANTARAHDELPFLRRRRKWPMRLARLMFWLLWVPLMGFNFLRLLGLL